MIRSETMVLPDGRTLSWSELGLPDAATVVVANHGTGSSRLELAPYDDLLGELGIRVVAPERPGYGWSSPRADGRRVADWVPDVHALVDHLGISSFVVSGYSGGGRHALAIAASSELADRVSQVFTLAATAPIPTGSAQDAALRAQVAALSWPAFEAQYGDAIAGELADLAPADQALLADAELVAFMGATLAEANRQGLAGQAGDAWAGVRPWGFDPTDVAQPVELWHGDDDRVIPVEHAHWYAETLPAARLHVVADAGHLSITTVLPEVFASLAA